MDGKVRVEILTAIVQRITFHSEETGWSVLQVIPVGNSADTITVTVHQTKVFPGATLELKGNWTTHNRFGRQFKAVHALEKKPATTAALEKYLGSGLIKGVGPKTAQKIVNHFGGSTLDVFEEEIDRLTEVAGIAKKKLHKIKDAWFEHRLIRDVMIFLQSHGVSTLFAVKIFKEYGTDAISTVSKNPYRLANDFYGIGFLTADKIALSIGLLPESQQRISAAIKHILKGSHEFGHCYLTGLQIEEQARQLLNLDLADGLDQYLAELERSGDIKTRNLIQGDSLECICYYSKALYFAEQQVAVRAQKLCGSSPVNLKKARVWLSEYSRKRTFSVSKEQEQSILGIAAEKFSILTGGPGCGKTTTTKTLVALLTAMGGKIALAAPTGRAAQRMGEVIGLEALTIHRLLEWQRGGFKRNKKLPIEADYLIVDECSMLDVQLTAALFDAVPDACSLLLIGDADQLPSVGAGNVLLDLIECGSIPSFRLTRVFRQAGKSLIIKYAHSINRGETPKIDSPFHLPSLWQGESDCFFLDTEEATQEQLKFIARVKRLSCTEKLYQTVQKGQTLDECYEFQTKEPNKSPYETDFVVPDRFRHVNLQKLQNSSGQAQELAAILKKLHPWSSLRYGLTASQVISKLYTEWIPKYYGEKCEIQILTPMTRGTLGTIRLNKLIQMKANPPASEKYEITVGDRLFREGDRVIHRRNNYDLQVFNGDIGVIRSIDTDRAGCSVMFYPDGKVVQYRKDDLMEVDLAYGITIHKSQGSEFEAVIIPVFTQHFKMLYRNLIYTGLTRARKVAVFVGTRRALAMAVNNMDTSLRQTALKQLLRPADFS